MKSKTKPIRSKVGRRILILFFLCALLPISALAIISFFQVSRQLNVQNQQRLFQESKVFGELTFDRIGSLELALSEISSEFLEIELGTSDSWSEEYAAHRTEQFESLAIIQTDGTAKNLMGDTLGFPPLTRASEEHLSEGLSLLSTSYREYGEPEVMMARLLDPASPGSSVIVGKIRTDYLWRLNDDVLPLMNELTILDENGNILYTSFPVPPSISSEDVEKIRSLHSGPLELSHSGETYVANFWTMYLRGRYQSDSWVVVLSVPRGLVQAPMARFGYYFSLIILVTVWVVLLLSVSQIRRNLIPLKHLQDGTRRIAEQDFASRVDVYSGDEFEELADSFNLMASQLGQQFSALSTTAEIDRAVLSLLDEERIIETVLNRACDMLNCGGLVVTIFRPDGVQLPRSYTAYSTSKEIEIRQIEPFTREELDRLRTITEVETLPPDAELPSYVQPLIQKELVTVLLLPIRLRDELAGVIALGYPDIIFTTDDELQRARQLGDRFTVALSNARLVEELDQLSWGTLFALARAIDAKSPWTAGHSERVTSLALSIGRKLGMKETELDTLKRGGLLHDLGKIGVPETVLDKRGRLSDEEMEIMRGHTRLGAQILEPIPAFSEVIPIVLQHHEHYQGAGYPDGLVGEEISVGARIVAVADFFEAMTADRPYRPGHGIEATINGIHEKAGKQFDPTVVEAFMEVIRSEGVPFKKSQADSNYGNQE